MCELIRKDKVKLLKESLLMAGVVYHHIRILLEWRWWWFVLERLGVYVHPCRPFPPCTEPGAWCLLRRAHLLSQRAPWEKVCTQWIPLSSF